MRLLPLASAMLMVAACTATTEPTTEQGQPETTTNETTDQTAPVTTEPGATGSGLSCWSSEAGAASGELAFVDVSEMTGIIDPLKGMHGHAAIWTDVDGDDEPDLFVGTYADREPEAYQERGAAGPSPDRLLIAGDGVFDLADGFADVFSRSSGGATADLDNDGDLDLVVSRNIKEEGLGETPTEVYENDSGSLTSVEDAGIPAELGGRSVGVLDYDGDGLIDLYIVEDRFTGGSSVLLRNEGGLRFRDTTSEAGLPTDVHGLGVAIADLDGDGARDIFVSGSNRLFLADGSGGFDEADSSVFAWETYGDEDDVAGVSAADVNRDGLIDLVVGQHFNSTVDFGEQVPVRLYLNRGGGSFEDVTEAAGLTPLPTKAPHVEINDFNNDGWPDILTSASAAGGPAIFVHEGLEDGTPRFATPQGLGDPQYWVGAPTVDYDHDGRLDVFLLEWEPSLPSILLRNETSAGNWIQLSVGPEETWGNGWRVEARVAGELVGAREITVTQGYSSGVLPIVHFGLGDADEVSLVLIPPGEEPIDIGAVPANQHIRWPDGCG